MHGELSVFEVSGLRVLQVEQMPVCIVYVGSETEVSKFPFLHLVSENAAKGLYICIRDSLLPDLYYIHTYGHVQFNSKFNPNDPCSLHTAFLCSSCCLDTVL